MRVSCIQMQSGMDVAENLERAAYWLRKAGDAGCELAVLPENFSLMGGSDADKRVQAEPEEDSRVLDFLSEQAAGLGMAIIGGSTGLTCGQTANIRNSCAAFDRQGKQIGIYDKIHLFDVDVDGQSYRESSLIKAGNKPVQIHVKDWSIGLSVCYDLRFPELYRHYSAHGCQLVTVVAAFTVPTGRAHWQVLLQARAIENQCYVLASAQTGRHPDGRQTWGHSMIVDPWGDVLAVHADGEGMATAEISLPHLESVRNDLPVLQHRKLMR